MPDHVIVRCPACHQKYRINAASVGRNARCKVCRTTFVIGRKHPLDDDTVVSWITQDAPPSASVMGATGIFEDSREFGGPLPPIEEPSDRAQRLAAPNITLLAIDDDGVHVEFLASLLMSDDLRNAFPRRCAGCGAKHGLGVHLVYWPERMTAEDRPAWRNLQDAVVGRLDVLRNASTKALLITLPASQHAGSPFRLPFPVFVCNHCHASREVRGHVESREGVDVCHLTIASLSVAADFFRNGGGRDSDEYRRLIDERDRRTGMWRDLGAEIRERLARWFETRPDERFIHFFRDAEFSSVEAGSSGVVLTDHRIVFKKYAAHRDYPLDQDCRVEIRSNGANARVQIFEEGSRPATFTLSASEADDLVGSLRTLGCRWTITR